MTEVPSAAEAMCSGPAEQPAAGDAPQGGQSAAPEGLDPVATAAGEGEAAEDLVPSAKKAHVVFEDSDEEPEPVTYLRLGVDYELTADMEDLHVQCGRLAVMENLDQAPKLTRIALIANHIKKVEGLEANTELEHLEVYQSHIKRIENIAHLTKLECLDFSFNNIRIMQNMGTLVKLRHLYLPSNKIVEIEGLDNLTELTILELGANRIRDIENIAHLQKLEQLWLGKNKITSMALPGPLPALKQLSLQSNRLTDWHPTLFTHAPALEHLYLGHNGLPNVPDSPGMNQLEQLKELDLAGNPITELPELRLSQLEDLWANDCKVESLEQVEKLALLPVLDTVYLERNPLQADAEAYREAIIKHCPKLTQLDADPVVKPPPGPDMRDYSVKGIVKAVSKFQ
eukprot:CAMPEP_0204340122 /NCGR_PEP_ID=MMETSP0469-20131031/22332_1 /ASSEMBLY_ACC=CAM_ASM_000384 /TAXON_ID=2969 /ORGANISM="Oxyrrhis marina" /LENGTH=398 /DNA_ID=CAMNT_0051324585 /DNA_START=11 /DNA_END=1207 /DNA_ORIENTATION=+